MRASLIVLIAFSIVIGVPLYHGLTHHFLDNADPDVELAYSALVFNSGRQIPFSNFTSYGQVLILGPWLSFVHWLGLIPVKSIDQLIGTAEFERGFAAVIYAGRALTILFACLVISAQWLILRLATRDYTVAALGTLLIASSQAMSGQFVLMRPELPAMLFVLCTVAVLIHFARSSEWSAIVAIALAGFTGMFAVLVKVQAVFLVLPLAVLPLLFQPHRDRRVSAIKATPIFVFTIISFVISFPALLRLYESLLAGKTLAYQSLVAAYLIICFTLYGVLRIRSGYWMLATVGGLLLGACSAFYLILINDHWWTPYAIVNFIDFMSFDANVRVSGADWGFFGYFFSLSRFFIDYVIDILFTNRLQQKDYWFQLVYWAAIGFILANLFGKKTKVAVQSLYFLGLAFALVSLFSIRSYHYYYEILIEPWVITAAGIGAAAYLHSLKQKRIPVMIMVSVVGLIAFVELRYHLIAPSTAKTRHLTHVCCYLNFAELIGDKLKPYCEKGIRDRGGMDVPCWHDNFPRRMEYFLQSDRPLKPWYFEEFPLNRQLGKRSQSIK